MFSECWKTTKITLTGWMHGKFKTTLQYSIVLAWCNCCVSDMSHSCDRISLSCTIPFRHGRWFVLLGCRWKMECCGLECRTRTRILQPKPAGFPPVFVRNYPETCGLGVWDLCFCASFLLSMFDDDDSLPVIRFREDRCCKGTDPPFFHEWFLGLPNTPPRSIGSWV